MAQVAAAFSNLGGGFKGKEVARGFVHGGELIDGYLKGKAQYVMDVIRKGIAIYVSLILMYSGYGLIEIGGYQISPAMGIPMSLLYGIMFIGFIMNFLALIVDTWEEFGKEKEVG